MKQRKFKFFIVIAVFSIFTYASYSQEPGVSQSKEKLDSISKIRQDEDRKAMNKAKDVNKEYKEKAKEAQRIEKEANNASVQSKRAMNAEKKAQRSRNNAIKQSKKASEARIKSDKNQ